MNFSLTNTSSSGNKEIYLPGVHSDIGGGYTDNYEEKLVIYKGNKKDVYNEKQRILKTGWFTEDQIKVKEPPRQRGPSIRRKYKLEVNRIVRNEYDRIPLLSAHYSGTGMEPRFVEGERKRLVYEG